MRYLASLLPKIGNAKFRTFATMDEAHVFLAQQDETLDLKSPER